VVEIAAPVAHPDRIAVGRDGLVWVTDVDADRVASVDATGRAGPAFDVGPVGAGPVDVLPIAGGIWFTTIKGANPDPRGAPAHRIGRLDPASGTLTWTEVPGFAELGPTSLADDPWRDGIWFTDIGDRRVSYIALDSPAVVGQSWGFEPGSAPAGIDVGRDRTVWVADQGANRIRWLTGL
jgi:streptogramin lyase